MRLQMAASTVPQAVQSCHELLLWLIPQLDKFPRMGRFTLGERIEGGLLEVLELLVEAAYQRNKEAVLNLDRSLVSFGGPLIQFHGVLT
jgi:hypothetical protein